MTNRQLLERIKGDLEVLIDRGNKVMQPQLDAVSGYLMEVEALEASIKMLEAHDEPTYGIGWPE